MSYNDSVCGYSLNLRAWNPIKIVVLWGFRKKLP